MPEEQVCSFLYKTPHDLHVLILVTYAVVNECMVGFSVQLL